MHRLRGMEESDMLYEFRGYDGQIELYENKIIIKRKGFARATRGFTLGDKEIYLSSITGIQVKKPGVRDGYIQFLVSGSQEVKGKGMKKAAKDENTVLFMAMEGGLDPNAKYNEALELKHRIELLKVQASSPVNVQATQTVQTGTAAGAADELLKFKELLDAGVITEEEFAAKKAQLLGNAAEQMPNTHQTVHMERQSAAKTMGWNEVQPKKTKKTGCLIVVAVVILIAIITSLQSPSRTNADTVKENQQEQSVEAKETTLEDVQAWYEDQKGAIEESLIEYAESKGASNVNVSEIKFWFGEEDGWYDCHYTVFFTCDLEGANRSGEARAFLKYQKKKVHWFHFEVFKTDEEIFEDLDASSIIEEYDESYDQKIEEYYKQLIKKYQ